MARQKIKVNRHKVQSILWPVLGASLLIGGATAGIVIGLRELPRVNAEGGTIEIGPGTESKAVAGKFTFVFKDNVDDNKVTAEISGDDAVLFVQDTDSGSARTLENLEVKDGKAVVDITLDEEATKDLKSGKYSFEFNMTFTYKKDGNEVIKKVENLRVIWVVA
mgnify:CR=1 FL=1